MELGSQLGPQNQQIHQSIQTRNKEPKVYLHPHFAQQKIPLGNHIMEHHHPQINITLLIMSETTIVETQR
jgi:hypothetical protein